MYHNDTTPTMYYNATTMVTNIESICRAVTYHCEKRKENREDCYSARVQENKSKHTRDLKMNAF